MSKATAFYVRVSSAGQNLGSQLPELEAIAKSEDGEVRWFKDTATGKKMDRPGFNKMLEAIHAGKVGKVVVWRLDRLGRTAKGLTALFEDFTERKIDFVSVKDGVNLRTPAGRMVANVLASIAAFETEVRSERQVAGIYAVKADLEKGTATWRKGDRAGTPRTKYGSGRKPGTRVKVTEEVEKAIREMDAKGTPKAEIARVVKVSRVTVYAVLRSEMNGPAGD
jgi:DNA invertase Pin-like site-specific DNA recombinase